MVDQSAQIECPVCACPLAGAVDVCALCRTPHHQDCARFLGRCALFGCGSLEFLTLDLAAASLTVEDAALDESWPDPAVLARVAPSGRLHRGVGARSLAALRLLLSEPRLSLFLLVFTLGSTVLSFGTLGFIATLLAQALLVISFSARARGKQATIGQAAALVSQRAGRVIRAGFASWLVSWTPLSIGVCLCFMGLAGGVSIPMVLAGAVLASIGAWLSVSCCLVLPIAAMDPHEEPEGALGRSAELVRIDRGQAAVSTLVLFLLTIVAPVLAPVFLAPTALFLALYYVLQSIFSLFAAMYWFLFYLETRKAMGAGFLAHAPVGYLPPAPRKDTES